MRGRLGEPVEGTGKLRGVGPARVSDGREAARNSGRDLLHGRMNLRRQTEGTGGSRDPGASGVAFDVQENAPVIANKAPQERTTLGEGGQMR
jgi:hypothetical protein